MAPADPENLMLTIFTPAYNRAHLLPRLFDSIKSQVDSGDPVEWLVIDDGSSDDTEAVLARFASERPDLVRFVRVENGGKHRAINRAARLARGEWIMIVDSDDRLADGAIRQVLETIRLIESDPRVGLLRALKHFPELDSRHRFEVQDNPCQHIDWVRSQQPFDTAEVIRRTALQTHPFPDFPGERFMAEGWLWHRLDRTHLTFFVERAWVECFYQDEGLSASSRRIRANSPYSAMEVYAAMLESGLPMRLRVRTSINWWRYHFHANRHTTFISPFRVPVAFAPLGWFMFLHDKTVI